MADNNKVGGLYEFSHGMYARDLEAEGRQLVCLIDPENCAYRTSVWNTDDGSAEEQFYRHKWNKHEPETVPAGKK